MRRFATRLAFTFLVGFVVAAVGCADAPAAEDAVSHQGDEGGLGQVLAGAEVPAIECTSPVEFTTVALAGGATSALITLEFTVNVAPELADGTHEVRWFVDTSGPLGSQQTTDPIHFDLEYGEHLLTLAIFEGDTPVDGPQAHCTVDVRVTRACFDDTDCADALFCNTNSCSPGGGAFACAFGPPPIAGCCDTDWQCAAGSVCHPELHTCEQCATDDQCDDGNGCTTDTCAGGVCQASQDDPDCCDCALTDVIPVATQCVNAGVCSTAECDCGAQACVYVPIPDVPGDKCCETGDHATCDDGDPCTEDACLANACRNSEVLNALEGCCNDDSECNDGNPCTTDACHVDLDTCIHEESGDLGCCATDQDCDDGDPTTWDACLVWQCVYTENFLWCEPPASSQVVIHELMIDPAAVSDSDGEWVELYNQTDQPIDLSGWTLTEVGAGAAAAVLSPGAPLIIGAMGFATLCRNGDPETNGGIACDLEYGAAYTLANGADTVLLLDAQGLLHDEVNYDGGPNFPTATGASIAMTNPQIDNDVGASWEVSFAIIGGGSTTDKGTPGSANLDVFAHFELAQCAEQPDDDVCTIDTCIDNTCTHISRPDCCNLAEDCVLPSPCHESHCVANECQYTVVPAPACCEGNLECDDTVACTLDRCVSNVCKHGPDPSLVGTQCCSQSSDCPGFSNGCVVVECDGETSTCLPPQLVAAPGCCTQNTYPALAADGECDDGDPSTIDTCKDYQCLSFDDPGYCDAQPGEVGINNCHLDANPCTNDECDVATNTCLFNPLPDCCIGHADCFDGNPCTADACELKTGKCSFPWVAGCCFKSQEAEHCDDGNICTTDTCGSLQTLSGTPGESWGRCRSVKDDPSCCITDIECSDGDACSVDTCDQALNLCAHEAVVLEPGDVCCDPLNPDVSIEEQCADQNLCTTAVCVENLCEFDPVPPNQLGDCCDLNAPGAGTEAEQCDDGSACTIDACVFARCRHIVTSGMDCCASDSDCEDGDACTTDTCVSAGGAKICANSPVICDDGLYCNGVEACESGSGCGTVPGSVPVVDDGVACTVDLCDEAIDDVAHFPDDAECDDGFFCNGAETCSPTLGCQGSAPPLPADDGILCTEPVCDEAADEFTTQLNHAVCSDGKGCNGVEQCDPVAGCVPGAGAGAIDDGVACTVDVCDDNGDEIHLPEHSLCNDSLVCTQDQCDPTLDCQHALQPGFCLIGGICYVPGALNPANQCEHCDPALSTSDWSPKPTSPEICNGLDDDCDGLVDEDLSGKPLTEPCANACGDIGIETCSKGAWFDCTAPELVEDCTDGIDNDCNGVADDGPDCGNVIKPPAVGADVRFWATVGEVENLVLDHGDGTYTTWLQDLSNPNKSGAAWASAYGDASSQMAFDVVAAVPVQLEIVSLRDTLYADNAEVRLAAQLRDQFGRPAATGTQVNATIIGVGVGASSQASCATDPNGRCTIQWTAPPEVFQTGQTLQITTAAGPVTNAPTAVAVVGKPAEVIVPMKAVGMQMPVSPRFVGEIFTVPIYVNSGPATVGSYDIHISFNKFELNATAVQKGSCSAFDVPVNNLAQDANTTGVLKINAINISAGAGCGSGVVHVANISFKVLSGLPVDDPGASSAMTLVCKNVFDTNLTGLCKDSPGHVGSGAGSSTTGAIVAWSRAVAGILARAPDSQLLNRVGLNGNKDKTQLVVTAYKRDYSSADVAVSVDTAYGVTTQDVATVSVGGLVTAGDVAGETIIAVTHLGAVSTARVRTLLTDPVDLSLSDIKLQPIDGAVTPSGSNLRQDTVMLAKVAWVDGSLDPVWEQDVTGTFANVAQVLLPSELAFDKNEAAISGATVGTYPVTIKTPSGAVAATTSLEITDASPAGCLALDVVAPCQIEMQKVDPASPGVQLARTELTAGVFAYMNTYQQKCNAQIYANYDDGSRRLVTGTVGLVVQSMAPTILTSTSGGLLTAQSAGTATVSATWALDGETLCTGATPVMVDLPAAVDLTVSPQQVSLSVSPTDPATTVKGLATSQQLQATVHYEDGSSQVFTSHATTDWDGDSGDIQDLVTFSGKGLVASTGVGAGTATVKVSVGLYPNLAPATAQVTVVEASGLEGEVFEPYTPTLPAVTDHTLSFIEGTNTRQDGVFQVNLEFSDGSSVEVSQDPALEIKTVLPGTSTQIPTIVVFDKPTQRVLPGAPGTVDVIFELGSQADILSGFVVDSNHEGIVLLSVLDAGLTTFTGIKDKGEMTVKIWGVFNDGTRRRFFESRFIPGLLEFGSTVPSAATINTNGLATIHGNKSTLFTVDVNPTVDANVPYDPETEYGVDCNLAPDCGDVDLGDTVGLAFKDRAPGETFTLEARINTCSTALGAFDLELHYDNDVVNVTSVEAIGATIGAVFNANHKSAPGTIFANAIFNPLGGIKTGSALPIFRVHYEAAKGGSGVSTMAGQLISVVAIDIKTPIGPPTPRDVVAAFGELDPECRFALLPGDVDGNCVVDGVDMARVQRALAGLEPLPEGGHAALGLLPSGTVTARDLLLIQRGM